jgi:5-(carboxyamino)imidazole ribonucleotide mutase
VAKSKESKATSPVVGLIMGSKSDWETMSQAAQMLDLLAIPYEKRVISAHRAPELLREYCQGAQGRGLRVIIAGAGGAAHLAGVTAAQTRLPVLGVPMQTSTLNGLDSLLSTVQMPKGIPVGTLAIGPAGAANAGLFAAAILALSDPALASRLQAFRDQQTKTIVDTKLDG